LLEATKIVLFEISSEDIPADPSVGYGKSFVELKNVAINGNPNFYLNSPTNSMNELDNKTLEVELASAKTALSDALSKQQILTSENDKLAGQVKHLESALTEKSALIANFEKKEIVASRYYDLRQKAEDLVSEAKLSNSEFNELFSAVPSEDIALHTKSQSDKLGHIEFHLELIEKRAKPLINLEQSIKEPVVNPSQPDSKEIESHAAELLKTLTQSPIFI
jgi:hypothetical protein